MEYKESESSKNARIWHDYGNDREKWANELQNKEDTKRRSDSRTKRNEKQLENNIADAFREGINNAQSTKEKRELKKDRDNAIERAKVQYSPTNKNTTIDDDGTDQTGSNPENGDGGSSDGGGGGGLPDGFEEERIDIVDALNNPSYRFFLTKFD